MTNKSSEAEGKISTTRVARDDRGERTPFEELEVGRELGSIDFVVTPEMVRAGGERSEDYHEWYTIDSPWGGPIVPVNMLYMPPRALFSRLHNIRGLFYKYEFENIIPIKVGQKITVTAHISEKWVKNDREFVAYEATYVDEDGNVVLKTRRAHVLDFIPITAPKTATGIDSGKLVVPNAVDAPSTK